MFHWRRKAKETDRGLYLGRLIQGKRLREELFYSASIHALTIGPNGCGKGTRFIIPNIASLLRSILVIDPKGEVLSITGRARARLGRVVVINPFNVLIEDVPHAKSTGFNALSGINPDHDNFTDDCSGIGQALVKEPPGNDGSFFGGSAQDLVTALIMHEKLLRRDAANLADVRRMLTAPLNESGLARTIAEMTESSCEPLRSKAGRFANGSRATLDIIATAINETSFLDSPPIARDLSGPGFDWDVMKQEIVTVYLVLPADRLQTHANFLRLIVTSALRALLRSPPSKTLPPVLFVLDEFAQLGYLPPIENAMGIARGFGVQLWPILQDLGQLKSLYRDRWESFIANAGLVTAFAPRDLFTAQYLSNMCGKMSRNVRSRGMSDDGRGNWNDSPRDFPRHPPEELMRMPAGQMLCLASDVPLPFFTRVPGYWDTPYGRDLDPNPYYRPRS